MVVTLGHISHICGNSKDKPKPHGAAHGANRSREVGTSRRRRKRNRVTWVVFSAKERAIPSPNESPGDHPTLISNCRIPVSAQGGLRHYNRYRWESREQM